MIIVDHKKEMFLKYCILILLFVSQFAFAECDNASALCAKIGEWDVSVGIGAGIYTNPLHDSDDIPLVLVPNLSYYDEHLFFQNNTLGYTFYETDVMAFSAITSLNTEYAFFDRWHPHNIIIPNASNDFLEATPSPNPSPDRKVSYKEIKKRKWALDAGVLINWFISDTLNAEFKLLHDVNNAYDGFNANAQFSKVFQLSNDSLIEGSIGVQWNSNALVNYYYGIRAGDTANLSNFYKGGASINPYINLGYTYHLNERWEFKAFLKRKKLAENTYLSPLVKDKTVDLIFIGFFYEF